MIKVKYFLSSLLIFVAIGILAKAQSTENPLETFGSKQVNWYNLSPKTNRVMGADVNKVYDKLLPDLEPKKMIIVAVLDSGVDTEHEDLQGNIWVNDDEIVDNGIDDDGNGYIDDINGWNFLGNSEGKILLRANYEELRIYRDYKDKYENIESIADLSSKEKKEAEMFFECKKTVDSIIEENSQLKNDFEAIKDNMEYAELLIQEQLGDGAITDNTLKQLDTNTEELIWAKEVYQILLELEFTAELIDEILDEVSNTVDYYYNPDYDPREITGDNSHDITDKYYGNNKVKGIEAVHGTFVAGIIAGVRNNGIGIDGIADNVEIMVLRVVPDGDEYDKDIALAVRYAVDNGANIINMSFGKNYSPDKLMVDDAMKYAEANNVLLVHSSGNESQNLDETLSFPNKLCLDGHELSNWISVGASDRKKNKYLASDFSNYGKIYVDLYAPGVDIVSTRPFNKYDMMSGTSFSCPVVSGVAALLWSYYPELKAVDVKNILEKSIFDVSKKKVLLPYEDIPSKEKYRFGELSKTGGIVNAFEAFILAKDYAKVVPCK